MTHSIDTKLTQLQRRARSLARWFGLCASITLLVGVLLCVAWLDHVWRYSQTVYRYVGFAAICLVLVFAVRYLLLPALRYRPERLSLAMRLEALFPLLRNRLTSATSFLDAVAREQQAGTARRGRTGRHSLAMENAVIAQADELIGQVPWTKALNASATYIAAALASLTLAALLAWSLLDSQGSRIAIQRNLAPWSTMDWPQRNRLEFSPRVEVAKRGSTVEFRVVDGAGSLPERIVLEVVEVDRDSATAYEMSIRDDEAVLFLDNVQRDLLVRARGGDDETEWMQVRIVNAPQVESLTVSIQPPDYLAIEPLKTSGTIQAWRGSRISWEGRVDRPIESASLIVFTPAETTRRELELDATRTRFHLPDPPWPLEMVGKYQIELIDDQGVVGKLDAPVAMKILEDQPPEIRIVLQALQRVSTVHGIVPYNIDARDDIRLSRGQFSITQSNKLLLDRTLDLTATTQAEEPIEENKEQLAFHPDRLVLSEELPLAQFPQLQPGDELQFRASVEDGSGQIGRQEPITLTLVSDDEYLERLSSLELQIQEKLNEAYQSQQRATRWLQEMRTVAEEQDAFLQRVDELDFTQRQVASLVGEGTGAATQLTRELMNWLQLQRLVESTLGLRGNRCLGELERLRREPLADIQATIDEWLAMAETPLAERETTDEPWPQVLQRTSEWQQEALATLESLIDLMGQSRKVRGLIDELRQIQVDQEQLASDLNAFQLQQLQERMDARQREIDQDQLVSRQTRIAERLDQLLSNVETLVQESDNRSGDIQRFQDLLQLADQLLLVGTMRDAATHIREQRLGLAMATQPVILEGLAKLLALAREGASVSQLRLQELSNAQQRLTSTIRQQKDIADQIRSLQNRAAAGETIREDERRQIADQQQDVRRSLDQLAEQLDAAGQKELASRLRDTGRNLERSIDAALSDLRNANIKAIQDEIDALDEIDRLLKREVAEQMQQQFAQQRERWVEQLERLRIGQQAILETTSNLMANTSLDPAEMGRELEGLRREQSGLREQVGEMIAQPTTVATLSLIMQQVAREMEHAERNLSERESLSRAVAAMRNSERLIRELLETLQPTRQTADADPKEPTNETQPRPPRTAQSASLRAIRILQHFVYEQTVELERKIADGDLARSREDYQRLAELGQTQRLLIELIQQLQADIKQTIESTPESPPLNERDQTPPLQIPLPGIDRRGEKERHQQGRKIVNDL